jgi:ornithine carbamoyltransferase
VLLATVHELQRAAQGGDLARTLIGKHLCLLRAAPADNAAALFRHAARELGAQVTDVDPQRLALATDSDVARCGRMLGRLYDAVECEGMAPALVDRLRASAGVPVYDGLALDPRLMTLVAGGLQDMTPEDQRLLLLQALLVSALA